jgi:glycosyltransferase involved in cell wall biosynthesis
LDIGSSLTLGGFRRNARRFLPAFDLFILPSTSPEPLGVVILEAMAAAIPVIATAHGGSVEMVVDGVTGMLVPPGDPEALAQAIAFLLNDPERCRAMGLAGRERFYKHFSLDQYLRGVEALYASVDKV